MAEAPVAEQGAVALRPLPTPVEPSSEEIAAHMLTHLPYRSWCPHCVRGKGKSMAHRSMEAEASHAVPHVSMDYSFLGQEDEKTLPVALVRDHASKTTFSHVVPCKGVAESDHPAKQVAFSIASLGRPKIIFKTDNEPAMLALRAEVIKILSSAHGTEAIPEGPPVEAHQSIGVVEHAAGELAGQVRALNDQIQLA